MQGVKETVNLANLVLGNYVKESIELLLTAVRSLDIQTIVETKRHKKEEKEEKDVAWSSCMTN